MADSLTHREPGDREVLDAVKLWAEAAGLLPEARNVASGETVGEALERTAQANGAPGWHVAEVGEDGSERLLVWHRDEAGRSTSWHPDRDASLVWALALVSGLAADVGRCRACRGRGHRWLWQQERFAMWSAAMQEAAVDSLRGLLEGAGWEHAALWDGGSRVRVVACRREACPDCTVKPGRDIRETARLVLDAAPREATGFVARDGNGGWRPALVPGDPQARTHLAVFSGQWEAAGEVLGVAVSAWLRQTELGTRIEGWRGPALAVVRRAWERLTVPCERCRGTGRRRMQHAPGAVVFVRNGRPLSVQPGQVLPPGVEPPPQFAERFVRHPSGAWMLPDRPAQRRQELNCEDCNGHGRVSPKPAPNLRFAQEYECIPQPPEPRESSAVEVDRDEHGDSALADWLASRQSRRRARRRR